MLPLLIIKNLALVLGLGILIILLLGLLVGTINSWFLVKQRKLSLLPIKNNDRIMIIAPHPDDEILATGGLLTHFFKNAIPVKIIYLTCGDSNPSLFWRDKKLKFSPDKFIQTGIERKQEAETAIKILGGDKKDLLFLGYPDNRLWQMWLKPKTNVVSSTTLLNHSPYNFTFKKHRYYKGDNIISDLNESIKKFKPTIIFSPHLRETNLDHQASGLFIKNLVKKINWSGKLYYYLIHYKWMRLFRIYPPKNLFKNREKILYPPCSLWEKDKWFSFWLQPDQLKTKKTALRKYKSQRIVPTLNWLFRSFSTQNEIFQLVNHPYRSSRRKSFTRL